MNFSHLLDPSTLEGAYFIGISCSLIAGIILGFFSGKTYWRKTTAKAKQKGDQNVIIQNSSIKGGVNNEK